MLLVASLFASGSALAVKGLPIDTEHIPVILAPDSPSVNAGTSVDFTVTMDGAVTSNTSISLSSNNAALAVPSSVTVLTGNTTATFTATTNGSITTNQNCTVTASANGGSSQGVVSVRARKP